MPSHALFQCDLTRPFWFGTSFGLRHILLGPGEFKDVFERLLLPFDEVCNVEELVQWITFELWRLWKNRNNVVFRESGDERRTDIASPQN
ncbi:hypothetical protein Syun_009727 [Stephania yunnanensis]|uniref:Uncharacterized protein n=1 Tax=Stephania yunnanensis TaxID=152371 RepID=A0AAP0PNV4_9MAGN